MTTTVTHNSGHNSDHNSGIAVKIELLTRRDDLLTRRLVPDPGKKDGPILAGNWHFARRGIASSEAKCCNRRLNSEPS